MNHFNIEYISTMKNKKRKKILVWLVIILGILVSAFILVDDVVMPRYVQLGKTLKVPNVVGLPIADAMKVLKDAGLQPKEAEHKQDRHYPVGTVIGQNPPANAEVKSERGVYLTISGGEKMVVVPNIQAKSIREATFTLERYGLILGNIQYEPSDNFFENTIMSQEPTAGTKVSLHSMVHVIVSQGRAGEKEVVPNVVGKTLSEAEKFLTQSGFTLGKVTEQVSLNLLPHTVLEQYPHAGELAPKGQPIDLIIAQKAEPKPDVEF